MKKLRKILMILTMMLSLPIFSTASFAETQLSIGIGSPNVNIAINIPDYPEFVVVPGYPVYYAPELEANFFFYDGLYWVYQDDNWYESSWYNGPWWFVDPEAVPLYVLRIPVRYYRQPPRYFFGWSVDRAPRWGEHWGGGWEQHRRGWDSWNHNAAPKAAPLPVYQQQYSGNRYPRQLEQQQNLQQKNYRFQPRDPLVKQHQRVQLEQRAPSEQPSLKEIKPQNADSQEGRNQHDGAVNSNTPQRSKEYINDSTRPNAQPHHPETQSQGQTSQPIQNQREQHNEPMHQQENHQPENHRQGQQEQRTQNHEQHMQEQAPPTSNKDAHPEPMQNLEHEHGQSQDKNRGGNRND